jgi:xylulokinase
MTALTDTGVPVRRVLLLGGGARSAAVRAIAPTILGAPVVTPPAAEYVAIGAARQAAWALAGTGEPPVWDTAGGGPVAEPAVVPEVHERYASVRRAAHGV